MNLNIDDMERFRSALDAISSKSQEELEYALRSVWIGTENASPTNLRNILNTVAPPIAEKYGLAAGELSAELFSDIYYHDTGHILE